MLRSGFPAATLTTEGTFGEFETRSAVLRRKEELRAEREEASKSYSAAKQNVPERTRCYAIVQECLAEEGRLEGMLGDTFLPQHSPGQLISPRAMFVSPLFRVRSKKVARENFVTFKMSTALGKVALSYRGPELRQSDGLVFMALLNLARDVKVGATVSFQPDELCRRVFGRYDGPSRKSLREHIHRLQSALLEFKDFTVQLCLRFSHPSSGPWTVALDEDIVQLFGHVPPVWLELQHRLALPEGLATWLHAFVESQSRLIPTKVESLRELCGSDASAKSFSGSLRESLGKLAEHHLIAPDWSIEKGVLRWMKPHGAPLGSELDTTDIETLSLIA
jgi:hypothetical protein